MRNFVQAVALASIASAHYRMRPQQHPQVLGDDTEQLWFE